MVKIFLIITAVVLAANRQLEASDKLENNNQIVKNREIYIPKDLNDCFTQFKKILNKAIIEKMKKDPESNMINYHFNLGMWMRNNWGLWKGSRLAKWFNTKGITHPDDMSGIILASYWRHLNNKPIMFDKQVKKYQDYWEKKKTLKDKK